ncbi:MFS transporter [Nonomuraea sp. NPDC001699]
MVHASEGWAVLAVMCASLFLVGIDLTVLNVALPSLTEELMPGATEVLWIVDVYSLTVAALLVTCGTLGDRLGRKRMVPAGFAVFGVASAAAAHSAGATVGPVLGGALVVGRGLPGQRAPRGLRADRRPRAGGLRRKQVGDHPSAGTALAGAAGVALLVDGFTPLQAGLALAPPAAANAVGAAGAPLLAKHWGRRSAVAASLRCRGVALADRPCRGGLVA